MIDTWIFVICLAASCTARHEPILILSKMNALSIINNYSNLYNVTSQMELYLFLLSM